MPQQTSNRLVPLLQRKLDDLFPESQTLVRKLEQGPPVIAPIELRLFGQSLNTLKTLGDKIRRIALETPGVAHARATLSEATPKLWLHVDETLSRQSGLSLTAISAQLRNGIDGVVQGSVLESTYSLPVRVRLKESQRLDMADIENINIVSPLSSNMSMTDNGFNGIPLSALGKVALEPARGSIPRIDGMRVNSIEIFPREGVLVAEVLDRVMASLEKEQFELPLGYTLEKAGQSSKRQDTVGNLMSSVGLILTLLVLVVVFSFNSFRISGIIFAVAVQAAGLGLLSIYVFGYPFGFTSIIALMGLVGLAINAAIVILAELKANENAVQGDLGHIAQSVALCSRHITATTITTIGGFLPLILAGGGFWPPFAIAIAGGTLLTTLVSFFFVPAAFTLFANKRPFEITQSGVLE